MVLPIIFFLFEKQTLINVVVFLEEEVGGLHDLWIKKVEVQWSKGGFWQRLGQVHLKLILGLNFRGDLGPSRTPMYLLNTLFNVD